MGINCTCSQAQLEKEINQQIDNENILNNNNEYILLKIKEKFDKYKTIEYISKEEFNKILNTFPNYNKLISEFKQKYDETENIQLDKTISYSYIISETELNNKKIIEPIKIIGDDNNISIYNCPINNKYEFNGKGYKITNIFLYYGNIENNKLNGKGIIIINNGDSIIGDFVNGFCTGKGILKIKDYLEYEGDFIKNKKEGYGIEKYNNGTIYEGEFKDNKKNGKGKYIFNTGEIYEGYFENDLYEGEGIYKWPSESREFIGHFKKGNMDGKGLNKYSDGSIFEGYYKNGKKHGKGIYHWSNGKIYKGSWINNKLHGNGYFEINNKRYNIIFRYGKVISTKESIDPNKIIKFSVENIVNKDLKNREEYFCTKCQKLIFNPQKCCKCYTNYCFDCIKNNGDNDKKCQKCEGNEYETNADLIFDLINNIKVFCEVCQIELNYESALNHVH